MFDVITFGSATRDVYLKFKKPLFNLKENIKTKKIPFLGNVCFILGSKVDVEDVYFTFGGGGANAAVTFANQGFKTAFCGAVGDDVRGEIIKKELQDRKISTEFMNVKKGMKSGYAIVLGEKTDRIIFAYRGASKYCLYKDIPVERMKAKWFYLAPLSGKSCSTVCKLVDFAFKNNIKIAINPSQNFIDNYKKWIFKNISKVNIFILNREELSSLLNKKIFIDDIAIKKASEKAGLQPEILIVTKGEEGASAFLKNKIFKAGVIKTKIADKTGAGDAFGSGFIAGLMKGLSIKESLQLATANSAGCIREIGAHNGLLSKNDKYKKVKVEVLNI